MADEVYQKDFLDSLEKIVLGPERPILLSRADRERIAYHEGGHAILGLVVPGADPVNRVTIVPRGQALGVTYQRPDSDRYNYPEGYLRARIIGMLGGGPPRRSSSAPGRPAPRTTSSRQRTSRDDGHALG
jgi:cell division protease FtsH